MPPLRFADLPRPDYAGGGLLNLMASIIIGRGGQSPHRTLVGLPPEDIRRWPKLALLVIDGLGADQLHDFVTRGKGPRFFARHPWQVISTVCPATTAAAVTTLATGSAPLEHAMLGWHQLFSDLGMVATPLPFVTRTDTPLAPPDFPLERYLDIPAPLATIPGRRVLISHGDIPISRTSLAQPWWTQRHAFQTLGGLTRHLQTFARSPVRGYAYAYWPTYDSLCHRYGPHGRPPARHLAEIDAALARIETALAGTNTLLLVTADHGFMHSPNHLNLAQVPGLYDTLTVLPSGDSRMVQCHVRPAQVQNFLNLTRTPPLSHHAICVPGPTVLRSGLLGPGKPHPALAQRLGDYVLFAIPGSAFLYPPAMAKRQRLKAGNHGGLSPDELRIPLYTIHP